MISRYEDKKLEYVWSDLAKYRYWLEVERQVINGLCGVGKCPEHVKKEIYGLSIKYPDTTNLIKEREALIKHDVLAFVEIMCEGLSVEAASYFHRGLTSSDITDTTLALQLTNALGFIRADLSRLLDVLKEFYNQYHNIYVVGRTHCQHAEKMRLGQRIDVWIFELIRSVERIDYVFPEIGVGKLSGPIGSRWGDIDISLEEAILYEMGLGFERAANQIVQRDRHAHLISVLAILAGSLEKIATEIRHLSFTEISEIREGFSKDQKGSSAMPHKMNPIDCEKICGLARIVRAQTTVAFENQNLWGERDISHSSAERYMFPTVFEALHHMMTVFTRIIPLFVVKEGNIKFNIELNRGTIFSSRILYHLQKKGVERNFAYTIVKQLGEYLIDRPTTNMGNAIYFHRYNNVTLFDGTEIKLGVLLNDLDIGNI